MAKQGIYNMMGEKHSTWKIGTRGFTLIEIVLALLVVTVGVLALVGLLGSSLDTAAKSHDDLNAVGFADMVLNYFHSASDWDEIPPSSINDEVFTVPDYTGGMLSIQLDTLQQFNSRPQGFEGSTNENYTVSYILSAQQAETIKTLTLQVWPGFGTNGTPRTFYTELYNWTKN
jgi:uncharacterized protein (TIGR02598 family)